MYLGVNASLARQDLPLLTADQAGQLLHLAATGGTAAVQVPSGGDAVAVAAAAAVLRASNGRGEDLPSLSELVSSSLLVPKKMVRMS